MTRPGFVPSAEEMAHARTAAYQALDPREYARMYSLDRYPDGVILADIRALMRFPAAE